MWKFIPLCCALSAMPSIAQITYPECTPLVAGDFTVTQLFDRAGKVAAIRDNTLSEPVQMDLEPVYQGDSVVSVRIYFVERLGAVKMFDGQKIVTLAKLPTWAGTTAQDGSMLNDNGLMGLALHPDFAKNHWLYLWHTPPITNNRANRIMKLSRFVVANNALVEEKILITVFGSKTDQWHCGGPMTFDAHGDLWVTVGNNSNDVSATESYRDASGNSVTLNTGSQISTRDSSNSAEWGSSNTRSLRGGVLRIHPDSSEKGYRIPSGNFGDYWSKQFASEGKSDLATDYGDTNKVAPEVYVKGTRSNYSIAVHPTKRWLAWGEVNFGNQSDEFNLVTHPAFTGFPYFHANQQVVPGSPSAQSKTAPTNNSIFNSGVKTLPPATAPVLWWGNNVTATTLPTNVAMGGPIYTYSRNLRSKVKFPPHMDHSWLLMSEKANSMYVVFLDSLTAAVKSTPLRLDNGLIPLPLRSPVQAKYGPEGSLYILNYSAGAAGDYSTDNPSIARIDYTGTCRLNAVPVSQRVERKNLDIALTPRGLTVAEEGEHVFRVFDLKGRNRIAVVGSRGAQYDFAKLRAEWKLPLGMYQIQVNMRQGNFSRRMSWM